MNQAVAIYADSTWAVLDMPDDKGHEWLSWAYAAIGNGCEYVEHFTCHDGVSLLVDEEARLRQGIPRNPRLTGVVQTLGGVAATWLGTGLLMRSRGENLTGLTAEQMRAIEAACDTFDIVRR